MKKENGFTMVEVLVVLAITAVILTISVTSIVSFSRREALEAQSSALASGLRDARARTLASVGGAQYGVLVEADRFTLFQGAAYDPNAVSNDVFEFSPSVRASSTISTVVFQRLTGNSTASGTIDIYLVADPEKKRAIGVSSTGLVSIE